MFSLQTKSNCDKLIKEVETKDKWLEEKRKRIDEYFKVIERLEEEKKRVSIIILDAVKYKFNNHTMSLFKMFLLLSQSFAHHDLFRLLLSHKVTIFSSGIHTVEDLLQVFVNT